MNTFDLDAYRAKVSAMQEHIFEDLQRRGLGDEDLDLTRNGGIELETILDESTVQGWKITIYLIQAKPLTYTLENQEGAEVQCLEGKHLE